MIAEHTAHLSQSTPQPLHALVVDDDPIVLQVICAYLTLDGYTVETAQDGRAGLAAFQAGEFDLVVTDWQMPHMKGDQLAAAIKKISSHTPIIMLTGTPPYQNVKDVDVVVAKPVTIETFRAALAKARAI